MLFEVLCQRRRKIGHYSSAAHWNSPFISLFVIDNPIEGKNSTFSEMRYEQPADQIEKFNQMQQDTHHNPTTSSSCHPICEVLESLRHEGDVKNSLSQTPKRQKARYTQHEYLENLPNRIEINCRQAWLPQVIISLILHSTPNCDMFSPVLPY